MRTWHKNLNSANLFYKGPGRKHFCLCGLCNWDSNYYYYYFVLQQESPPRLYLKEKELYVPRGVVGVGTARCAKKAMAVRGRMLDFIL